MLQIPANVSVVKFQRRKFFRLMTETKNHVLLDGALCAKIFSIKSYLLYIHAKENCRQN